MGGQACVFYGAAEFSRDCDIVVLAELENFSILENALLKLSAVCIAVPPMDWTFLDRGHAIHFRCKHPDALDIRLDVMSKMRGCDEFSKLWNRRTTLQDSDGTVFELLGIEDLVRAKKTQRDKDWPMIRRLVDSHYEEFRTNHTNERVRFWLRESRAPRCLWDVANDHPSELLSIQQYRPLLTNLLKMNEAELLDELEREMRIEQAADKAYWDPLKKELEQLRRDRNK